MVWFYRQYQSFSTPQKFVMNALALLLVLYGAGYGVTNVLKTSQQRAIETCVDDLQQTATGTKLTEFIEKCQKLCRQGELMNCP
jgi:hypothetical protein